MSDAIDNQNLKQKTAQGLFWGILSSGGMQLLNLIIGIFLARLLTPEDYGIVGMLAIFSLIAVNLQESGFGVALINVKDIKHEDYNSVFWFNVIVSLFLYIVLFLCAPLIADFFHQPRLTALSRFIFIAFLFAALGVSPNAKLVRALKMKEKAVISLTALIVSGTVGVTMAFNGFSYWSLAAQQVLYSAVICIGRYFYAHWWPTWHFDFGPVKRMFTFSYKVLITAILGTVSNNVLTVIFGRLFPAHDVGNFYQANKWNTMANSLVTGTVSQMVQPVLVQVNDDAQRRRRVFGKMLRFTAFLAFPVMLGLALVSREFILIAIGSEWEQSIPLLQILCLSGAFVPLYAVYQNLFLSLGKSDVYMWLNIAQIALVIAAVLSCHILGFSAMVIAFAMVNILWLLAWQVFASRLIGYSFASMLRDLLPFMLISLAVMVLTWLVTRSFTNLYLLLVSRVMIAMALYMAILKLLHARILDECMEFIKSRLRNKNKYNNL